VIRLILANPVMTAAYQQGVPGNGKPFPDGSKIAKDYVAAEKVNHSSFFREHP